MSIYKTTIKSVVLALFSVTLARAGLSVSSDDSTTLLGRDYYQDRLDQAMQRPWAFPATISLTIGDQGYGCNGGIAPLAKTIFGSDRFSFGDIFLLAKLSAENKITIPGDPLTTDVLTTLLAPVELEFDAETRELVALFTASYRRSLGETERMDVVIGLNVPIKTQFNILHIDFDSGSLLSPMGTNLPVSQSTLAQFFSFYEDVYDFFVASILEPKGLTYHSLQRKTGLGDITFFGYIDGAKYFNYVDALQVGVTWMVPTTTADIASNLWPIDLSQGGGSSVGFFSNALLHSPWAGINPALQVSVDISPTFYGMRRIAQLKQFNGPVDGVHNVIGKGNPLGGLIQSVPPVFGDVVTTFSEYDSTIPAFADAAVRTRIKRAPRVLAGIGNYFYNIFKKDFVLGIFYDYTHKAKDCFKVCSDATFDTASLAKLTEVNSHRISWRLSYRFPNYIELNGGTQHIVGGKNVIQLNQLYVSFIA
ncbi:MAG: hypothetical protein ACHQVS_03695, partial [Candidatus Babeliales bacterium]